MLKNLMVRQGSWLFRWRSYLPLLLFPLAVETFLNSGWMTRQFGAAGEDLWDIFCLLVALIGLTVRVMTVGFVPRGTSGRNTTSQQAAVLNTTGLYSVVRHPLYLGNFFIFMAFVMLLKSGLFAILAALVYLAYYERIILAEEEFLAERHGAAFYEWSSRTPVIIPRLRGWVAPHLPFSWRSALRREYHTVFLIAAVFFVSELLESVVLERSTVAAWLREEPLWALLAAAAAALYVAVRTVRKATRWLDVEGR
jgi:protein-S-isoprenylcysteine O-methyltransferase Ste14